MITMRKLMLTLVPIFFSLAVTTNLAGMDQARGRGFGPGEAASYQNRDRALGMLDRLNLAAEQKARIKALHDAHLMDIKTLQDKMFSTSGDLKLLWLQPTPNKERILAKQKEVRVIRDQIQDKSISYRLDILNILTPGHQAKAKAIFSEGRFGYGIEGGMGPGTRRMGN